MDKHPHEKLLDQIAQILQYAYDNAHKPIPSEKEFQLAAQLDELEKQVLEFKKVSDKILEGSGLTDYVYETMKEDKSSILNENERALLERAEFLKGEAQAASQDLQQAAQEAQKDSKQLTDKKKTKKGASRKGKFRSFGGVKNWKPL